MCGTYSMQYPHIDLSHHKENRQHLNIKGIDGIKGLYLNYLHSLNDKKNTQSLSLGKSLCVVPTPSSIHT